MSCKWHANVATHSAEVVVFWAIGLCTSVHAFLQASLYAVACKRHQSLQWLCTAQWFASSLNSICDLTLRFWCFSTFAAHCTWLYLPNTCQYLGVTCSFLPQGFLMQFPGLGCILPRGLWSRFQSGLWPWTSAFLPVSQVLQRETIIVPTS